jgi:hypothetical protein
MVHEFLDVILDELPGMPPKRSINFKIKLQPGIAPIAKCHSWIGSRKNLFTKYEVFLVWQAIIKGLLQTPPRFQNLSLNY